MAPLCFCVGLQMALKIFQKGVARGLAERGLTSTCLIYAYMDDINIVVHIDLAEKVGEDVEKFLEGQNLKLNKSKCRMLGQRVGELEDPPFPIEPDGTLFMGVPTGTKEYRETQVAVMLQEQLQPIPALQLLDPAVAFNILKACINQRASYLARVVEISEHVGAFNGFYLAD